MFPLQAENKNLRELMSYTDHQEFRYALGHLFRFQSAKTPWTNWAYRQYQKATLRSHVVSRFVDLFLNAEVFLLNWTSTKTPSDSREIFLQVVLRRRSLIQAFSLKLWLFLAITGNAILIFSFT